MPLAMAVAILHEHAGSQWDPAVVEQAISVATTLEGTPGFDRVGRASASASTPSQSLTNDDVVVPDDIGELLAAVDAEI